MAKKRSKFEMCVSFLVWFCQSKSIFILTKFCQMLSQVNFYSFIQSLLFNISGNIQDIENYVVTNKSKSNDQKIFLSGWLHLSSICIKLELPIIWCDYTKNPGGEIWAQSPIGNSHNFSLCVKACADNK